MNDKKEKIWLWGVDLSWELFSSAVYNYRLSLNEKFRIKRHCFYKNTILNSVTVVEAFTNSFLSREFGWSEKQLHGCKDKLQKLGIDYKNNKFKDSKFIRNNFIVHHKRIDQRYFEEITQASALEAIESTQSLIAEICFLNEKIFPYWITGLNFVDSRGGDICLENDREFWDRFKWLNVNPIINRMLLLAGKISPPKDSETYHSLYKDIWNEIKRNGFKFEILNTLYSSRFPRMPFLTAEWWS